MNDRGTEKPMGERQPPRQAGLMNGEGIDPATVFLLGPLVRELRQALREAIELESRTAPTLPEVIHRPYRRRDAQTVWSLREAR